MKKLKKIKPQFESHEFDDEYENTVRNAINALIDSVDALERRVGELENPRCTCTNSSIDSQGYCGNCGKPLPSHDTREKIDKIGEIIWVEAKTVTFKKADDIAKKILEVIHDR
jgi:hypothetical protein